MLSLLVGRGGNIQFVFECYQSNLNVISILCSYIEDVCLHLISRCFLFFVSVNFMNINIFISQEYFEELLFTAYFFVFKHL